MKLHALYAAGAATTAFPKGIYAGRPSHCCGALSRNSLLKDKVVYPDQALYDSRLSSYWSSSAALEPWCMVLPTCTDDVSAIAKTLGENECPFGIRAGGHSQFAGASSIHNGITVDFGYFNQTTYDADKEIVSIHPGAHWQMAYDTLEPLGVSVAGGRAGIVGVGGFTLGGGYSYYFNNRGFAADNVVNFEVVLADGQIANANAHENADLYKALKGSSGNLAFVTRFDMEGVQGEKLWGGVQTYSMEQVDKLWGGFVGFVDQVETQPESQAIVYTFYVDGQFGLQSLFSNNKAHSNASAFTDLLQIPTLSSSIRETTVAELSSELSGGQPIGIHADWFVTQFKTDIRMMDFVNKYHLDMVPKMEKEISKDAQLQTLCQFQPVSQAAVREGQLRGGNVMGLEEIVEDGASTMFLFTVQVVTAEDEATVIRYAQDFIAAIEEHAKELGIYYNWKFLNYSYKTEDPIGSYGAAAVKTIKDVSAKYDPTGMFQKLRQTGFRIPTGNNASYTG